MRTADVSQRTDETPTGSEPPYIDLAPSIHRQRLVVEGIPGRAINDLDIRRYLRRLTTVAGMSLLLQPVTHRSPAYGWAGWVHWETSGAHFYAWDEPHLFFSADVYTCKAFEADAVVRFTSTFFDTSAITWREF